MKTDGEEEETRTPTSQLTLPPQSSASTNSATSPSCITCEEKRVPRTGLEPARLAECSFLFNMLSGKRDSDPRPQPWQGCALPTELFPRFFLVWKASLSIADAKVLLFLELPKLFSRFFQKNIVFCTFCTSEVHYTLLYI